MPRKKLPSVIKTGDGLDHDAVLDALTSSLDAVFDHLRADPLAGAAYLTACRVESQSAAAGASFTAARIKGNQAALELIRKTKPGYKKETWRAMRHDIETRLGGPRPPSLRVVFLNPELGKLQPAKSGPVYGYDYATPMIQQIRRISTLKRRAWKKSLDEVFARSPLAGTFHLPNVKKWTARIVVATCDPGPYQNHVGAAYERAAKQGSAHLKK